MYCKRAFICGVLIFVQFVDEPVHEIMNVTNNDYYIYNDYFIGLESQIYDQEIVI